MSIPVRCIAVCMPQHTHGYLLCSRLIQVVAYVRHVHPAYMHMSFNVQQSMFYDTVWEAAWKEMLLDTTVMTKHARHGLKSA